MPAEVRAGVTPNTKADAPIGKWNRFIITMHGDRLTVNLNGKIVLRERPTARRARPRPDRPATSRRPDRVRQHLDQGALIRRCVENGPFHGAKDRAYRRCKSGTRIHAALV